ERRNALISRIGGVVLRIIGATWRVRFANPDVIEDVHRRGRRVIYLLWHGQLLPLFWSHRNRNVAVLISEHRDGEIIAQVARRLGSWDRFLIPKPFASITVLYGEAIPPEGDSMRDATEQAEKVRQRLDQTVAAASAQALR